MKFNKLDEEKVWMKIIDEWKNGGCMRDELRVYR
jgi:hypothetical protein